MNLQWIKEQVESAREMIAADPTASYVVLQGGEEAPAGVNVIRIVYVEPEPDTHPALPEEPHRQPVEPLPPLPAACFADLERVPEPKARPIYIGEKFRASRRREVSTFPATHAAGKTEKTSMDAVPALRATKSPEVAEAAPTVRESKPAKLVPVVPRPRVYGGRTSTLPDGTVLHWGARTPEIGSFTSRDSGL